MTRLATTAVRTRQQRVPDPTPLFWITKAVSTAMGEAVSDYSIHVLPPVVAVLCGFALFAIALNVQLSRRRYTPWAYWTAVGMVGVFGTMAADVMHVAFGVPYAVSSAFYAVVLALVFLLWWRLERTLSVHDITTTRRELLYWAAVVATFAMGTALGDLAAVGLGLGYLASVAIFAVVILIPALGYRLARWNAVFCFWFAYVVTRPLGASVADWFGKERVDGGLGFGEGWVSLVLVLLMAGLVAAMYRREPMRARGRGHP
ncbi:COG4705 family protein [Rathayibacter sp. CAU 1779]